MLAHFHFRQRGSTDEHIRVEQLSIKSLANLIRANRRLACKYNERCARRKEIKEKGMCQQSQVERSRQEVASLMQLVMAAVLLSLFSATVTPSLESGKIISRVYYLFIRCLLLAALIRECQGEIMASPNLKPSVYADEMIGTAEASAFFMPPSRFKRRQESCSFWSF